jgi:hypothetical protein
MAVSLGEPVKVRMLRSYGRYRAGEVVPVTGGLARTLELQRYAVRVADEPRLEFATAPEPANMERTETPIAKARRRKNA